MKHVPSYARSWRMRYITRLRRSPILLAVFSPLLTVAALMISVPAYAWTGSINGADNGNLETAIVMAKEPASTYCDIRRQDGKCWLACQSHLDGGRCFEELDNTECDGLEGPNDITDPTFPGVRTTPSVPAVCNSWRTKTGACETFCESDYGICFRTYPNNPKTPNVPTDEGLCARPVF
jgi:hypothetical protein